MSVLSTCPDRTIWQHRRLMTAVATIMLSLVIALTVSPRAWAADGDDTLSAGEVLTTGQALVSTNGAFRAVVQGDGNLVVYGPQGPRWWTGTSGGAPQLAMQRDGNVVLYAGGGAKWWTGTSGADGRLVMQGDGNLVLYFGSAAAWSITTGIIPVRPTGPAELPTGQSLSAGQQLVSPDGRFVAALQTDGNFVLYGPGSRALFASGTGGTSNARLVMQSDGNLVLYGETGARWQTATSGSRGLLAVQNDGNLVVYAGGRAGWSRTTGPIPLPTPVRSSLNAGETLRAGEQLTAGSFKAVVQTDGNFVVYDDSRATFSTGTGGTANAVLAMQSDGNLVLYGNGGPRWQTGTRGSSAQLVLQDDGNLVIYAGGRATWSVRTGPIPVPSFAGTGIYRVGTDVAAGTYRTRTAASGCQWARLLTDSEDLTDDDILSFTFTELPTVVTIKPSDPFFGTGGCAEWTADLSPLTSSPTAPFGDGTWIVGSDIAAGAWTPSSQDSCTWGRLSTFASDAESLIEFRQDWQQGAVEVRASDAGFYSDGCGTWTKVG